MGQNSRPSDTPLNQDTAVPGDSRRPSDKPGEDESTPADAVPPHDDQTQATVEEFSEEGMGVAAKE